MRIFWIKNILLVFKIIFHSFFKRTFWCYFGVAFLAMLVNIGTRFFYENFFNFGLSIVLSYFSGHIFNFALSAHFVFQKTQNLMIHFLKFSSVAILGLLVQYLVALSLLQMLQNFTLIHLEWQKLLAHLCGIACSFFANFLGHQFFSFQSKHFFKKRIKND